MDFLRVVLQVSRDRMTALCAFYELQLGLERRRDARYAIGTGELGFEAAAGEPFYHFAFLVPGDRFDAALSWAGDRINLLTGGDIDDVVFDFDNWNALACYFHDPADNIVELIAHSGIGTTGVTGAFDVSELLGFSELGLVGSPKKMTRSLGKLGLTLWDGEVNEPGRLGFVGERARTFILASEGRGWLPTGRPAEPHPVDVVLSAAHGGEVTTAGHRVRCEPVAEPIA